MCLSILERSKWNIRIYHECEGWIEKSVLIILWHHKACLIMTTGDHEGWIFLLTQIMDFFSCSLLYLMMSNKYVLRNVDKKRLFYFEGCHYFMLSKMLLYSWGIEQSLSDNENSSIKMNTVWTSKQDFGTYPIVEQPRLRWDRGAVLPDSLLLAFTTYGCRWRFRPKYSHLAQLNIMSAWGGHEKQFFVYMW